MNNLYMSLTYEQYKELEKQMVAFRETVHKTVTGYYHKSIRLKVTETLTVEFHGPIVAAEEESFRYYPVPTDIGGTSASRYPPYLAQPVPEGADD